MRRAGLTVATPGAPARSRSRHGRVIAAAIAVALVVAHLGVHTAAADESAVLGIPPWLATPKGWEAVLAPPGEPGGHFVMDGRLIGPDGKTGMAGIKVFVYHADRDGLYARERNRYMRLAGVLTTDAHGRYRIVSALPGQYGGPPHVHFEAWGPGLPLRLWYVNLYRGPNEKPDSLWGRMTTRWGSLSEDPPEAYVTRVANGVFHAKCDLYWERGFKATTRADSSRRGLGPP
jgi:Dioxygenase